MAGSTFLAVLHFFIDTDDPPVPGRITATGMQYVYCFSRTLSSWLLSSIFSHFYFFCC